MFFFFNDTATTEIYTLSLHDALPICSAARPIPSSRASAAPARSAALTSPAPAPHFPAPRSEEHTSELQSPCNLVCRLLLEKKKNIQLQVALADRYGLDNRVANASAMN